MVDLIEHLLADQKRLTAVDEFTMWHRAESDEPHQRNYHGLIPLSRPGPGEQYAFDVDLDACSGCKACVVACHRLNGLDDGEVWRTVGLLHGGSSHQPVLQHVTAACHHCIEPACLTGCPVQAYYKDPVTGIVHHLDDQCIGCKYCIFMCPYDVPVYNRSLGIVRKCDMCRGRLAEGEAPACVQACPNRAIRVSIVHQQRVIEECEAGALLPGTPEPGLTLPTTSYRSRRPFPRNMLPADYFAARPQHAHWPLIVMLVLTQMSVGAFLVEQYLASNGAWYVVESGVIARAFQLWASVVLACSGMFAAVFHLGRPQYAFRALLGLRTSWLSREILAFTLFPLAVAAYALAAADETKTHEPRWVAQLLGYLAALVGLAGLACSIMIYVVTRRPLWTPVFTTVRFAGTAMLLGISTSLVLVLGTTCFTPDAVPIWREAQALCGWLIVATLLKLSIEAAVFRALHARAQTAMKRTARLMVGQLGLTTLKRYVFGILGGVLLPAIVLTQPAAPSKANLLFVAAILLLALVLLVAGELVERYLFFTAVAAARMPGVPAS